VVVVVVGGDVSEFGDALSGGFVFVFCCGGFWMGVPVREVRRGGIIEMDWEVGERIRRRRGLEIVLTFGLSFSLVAGFVGGEEVIAGDSSRIWLLD
jgi:hypothetical protein